MLDFRTKMNNLYNYIKLTEYEHLDVYILLGLLENAITTENITVSQLARNLNFQANILGPFMYRKRFTLSERSYNHLKQGILATRKGKKLLNN